MTKYWEMTEEERHDSEVELKMFIEQYKTDDWGVNTKIRLFNTLRRSDVIWPEDIVNINKDKSGFPKSGQIRKIIEQMISDMLEGNRKEERVREIDEELSRLLLRVQKLMNEKERLQKELELD